MADLIDRQAAIEAATYGNPQTAWQRIEALPSAQPEDWMEINMGKILQAGKEGREYVFRIGGRLFAIRELAQ